MSGFTIGEVHTGEDKDDYGKTRVSIVDGGVRVYHYGRSSILAGVGGLGIYTPAKARELGQLLINAADRWAELNAHVKQAEAEIKSVQSGITARIKDLLA